MFAFPIAFFGFFIVVVTVVGFMLGRAVVVIVVVAVVAFMLFMPFIAFMGARVAFIGKTIAEYRS